jgi:hypothetical protein
MLGMLETHAYEQNIYFTANRLISTDLYNSSKDLRATRKRAVGKGRVRGAGGFGELDVDDGRGAAGGRRSMHDEQGPPGMNPRQTAAYVKKMTRYRKRQEKLGLTPLGVVLDRAVEGASNSGGETKGMDKDALVPGGREPSKFKVATRTVSRATVRDRAARTACIA